MLTRRGLGCGTNGTNQLVQVDESQSMFNTMPSMGDMLPTQYSQTSKSEVKLNPGTGQHAQTRRLESPLRFVLSNADAAQKQNAKPRAVETCQNMYGDGCIKSYITRHM